MNVYVIAFGPRSNRRYLAENRVTREHKESGWRAYRWVRDVELAEKWDSEDDAKKFANVNFSHVEFDVIAIPPMGVPGGDGGTPAAAVARAA